MPESTREILSQAIARNCAAVFSLPSAGLLRHQKSRFLRETSEGVWLESAPGEMPLVDELISTGKQAGVSFKNGETKIVFAAPILARNAEYRLNEQTIIAAAMIDFPADIKSIQRRGNYRVRVLSACPLTARVWRMAPRASIDDRPMLTTEMKILFRDLSIGGMGVTFIGENGTGPKVCAEDRLRIAIQCGDAELLFEGRMRQPLRSDRTDIIITGIAFQDMAADLRRRQQLSQLTKIISDLQRDEVRRARMGVA